MELPKSSKLPAAHVGSLDGTSFEDFAFSNLFLLTFFLVFSVRFSFFFQCII